MCKHDNYCDVQCLIMQFARQKAAELEVFRLPGEEPPKKKQRVEGGGGGGGEEEGEKEVDRFLAAVSCLPLDELGEEAARERLAEMVAQLSSSPSPHVRAIINLAQ